MSHFHYQPIFEEEAVDSTEYYSLPGTGLITTDYFRNKEIIVVNGEALRLLTSQAFYDVSHFLRSSHLASLGRILEDPESSDNDLFVAESLLKNAVIAAEGLFPSCQDTGTALVLGFKGESVLTESNDSEWLSRGIYERYQESNLRYSQLAPLSFFEEKNTGTNLPAQIDIFSESGKEYKFLFIAKGGGSANKSYLYQKSKAVLNPESFADFIKGSLASIGTAACPPYHLAVVVGGTSAEMNLKTVKLASCHALDHLPLAGNSYGRAFRDIEMEALIQKWAAETKIGAQFGGKYLVHDVRVIRLPRHGASCPVGIGLSCSADRQIKGKIAKEGIFLERLEREPLKFYAPKGTRSTEISIDLNQPMANILKQLGEYPVGTRVMLNGPMIVARDITHARFREVLASTDDLPSYFKEHPVYYAGPAKTPLGFASGSFGPTTSERMDPYVGMFQERGASLVMLGKGNRSSVVKEACARFGGFYLGSVGGPAALLGKESIVAVKVLDYADLGMEAVWQIEVRDFPAVIIINNKGEDLFAKIAASRVSESQSAFSIIK